MPIFACPKCGTHLNVPDAAAGQTVGCPRCGQPLLIPASGVTAGPPQQPAPSRPAPLAPPFSPPEERVASGNAQPSLPAPASWAPAARRVRVGPLTGLPKPILFALFGAAGALLGAILVELPFHVARPAAAPKPAVDVMFVLDVTGSMQPQIDGVREGIKRFVDDLRKQDLDVRVGLTSFRDRIRAPGNENPEDAQILRFRSGVLTDDADEFKEQMGSLHEGGGGDEPESSFDALAFAARQRYRDQSTRVLLLITDAPPHVPDFEIRDINQLVAELHKNRMDQVHLIIHDRHRRHYEALLHLREDLQGKSFSLTEVGKKKKGFDQVLPKVSSQVIHAVQSSQAYAGTSAGRLIFAIGLWTAIIALGLSLALIVGQLLYMGKSWLDPVALLKGGAGIIAGLLGGVIAQSLFLAGQGAAWNIVGRLLGWSVLGGLVGVGMALVVPNLVWWRGLAGGVMGGIAGALCFLALSLILPELLGRWFGALVLGFCIGLMVALAEMAFRRWWLEIRYGPREIRTVTLGAVPITVGSDERAATVVINNAPPLLVRYGLDDNRVWCEDVAGGRRVELEPGDAKTVNNVTITVCNAATRRSAGFVLKLSTGKDVPLSEGLPLTHDELPGLAAQGADGTVAIIQRRPSDPRTLLLLNRSRQPWAATERDGRDRTVTPGMGIAVEPGLRIDFGEVRGRLVHE